MKLNAIDGWVKTEVRPGAMRKAAVILRAKGQWHVRRGDDQYGIRNANGGRDDTGRVLIVHVQGNKAYPYHAPEAKMGQLIGKIGEDGGAFAVGNHKKFTKDEFSKVGADQALYLRINYPDEWMDKEVVHGHLDVTFEDTEDRDPFESIYYFDRVLGKYVHVQ